MIDKVRVLMGRLAKICGDLNWDTDLWARGLEVIQRKYKVVIWLDTFRPAGIIETEEPVVNVTITVKYE